MALPLPKVVSDVGPGGPLVTSMGGMNSLANDMLLRQINAVKAQYAPLTTQAEAASKLAYANLMGPQFLAKIMGNDSALANMSEDQKRQALEIVRRAGMGQGSGTNAFNQMQQGNSSGIFSGIGQPSTNSFSGWLQNSLRGLIGGNARQNNNALSSSQDNSGQYSAPAQPQQNDGVDHALDAAFLEWMKSPEAQKPNAAPPSAEALRSGAWKQNISEPSIDMELTKGQRGQGQPTYAENTGTFKGTIKEGEELGKHRANTIDDIGQQQLQLSASGANLDRIIADINDPKFMDLRKDFPFYQDMQLTALSKIGSPEQQEMVGNFIADVKSFAGATVNSFKGNSMKREFDYADQLKPNENDTVNTARGKLTALKALKEIAERKNDIILNLLQNKHMNLGDAVKQANKMVDVKTIDQEVKKLTSPMITIKNPKTGMTIRLPVWEARQRGVKNV